MRGKGRAGKAVAMAVKRSKGSSSDSGKDGKSSANAALVKNDALVKDVPQEVSFWLSDGRIIRSAVQLADAVRTMPDEVYEYHASQHKNDFADWVRDIIKDGELAYAVRKAANKAELGDAIRKRLKGELRIEEPTKTILEEPITNAVAKPSVPTPTASVASAAKPAAVPVAAVAEARPPQLVHRKDNAFTPNIRKLKAVSEKAAVIKNKTIISLPKNAVRVVSPADRHNAVLKKSPITIKHSASAKAAKKNAKSPNAHTKSGLSPDRKIVLSSDPAQVALGKREAELVRKEKELNEEEKKLNHARVELIKKRYELLKERGAIEKEKFERFISKRINGKLAVQIPQAATSAVSYAAIQTRQMQAAQQPQAAEAVALDSPPSLPASSVHFSRERVEAMIREARESIAQGNSRGAAEKFLTAQSLLSRTPLEPSEKRVLNYDLMELEADIRLEKLKAVQ